MSRRGHTLIELLAVMTASMTLLGTTAGLLHRALRTQSSTRHQLELEHAALRLARQIRRDVAAATEVSIPEEAIPTAVAPPSALIRLHLPEEGEVTYRVGSKAVHRYQDQIGSAGPLHEAYRMPAGMAWRADLQGPLLRLSGRREATPGNRPHDIEIAAGRNRPPHREQAQ